MPAPKDDLSNGAGQGKKKKRGHHLLAPWEAEVTPDEVEGGPSAQDSGVSGDYGPGPAGVGEDYYAPASQPSRYESQGPAPDQQNPSKLRSLVTGTTSARHRGDVGMSAPERGPSDRHARMNGARRRVEDPSSDRRNGVGYYDDEGADPWSRSSEAPQPVKKPSDRKLAVVLLLGLNLADGDSTSSARARFLTWRLRIVMHTWFFVTCARPVTR